MPLHPMDAKHVVNGFDLVGLGPGLVVDVSLHLLNRFYGSFCDDLLIQGQIRGASGATSTAIARRAPLLTFLVIIDEDLDSARGCIIPRDVAPRMTVSIIQVFDRFIPRLAENVKVYLLRAVLCSFANQEAIDAVRFIADSMDPGMRMVVCDLVLPPRETGTENQSIPHDRTLDEWENLFAAADPALRIVRTVRPEGSLLSIMEIVRDQVVQSIESDDVERWIFFAATKLLDLRA